MIEDLNTFALQKALFIGLSISAVVGGILVYIYLGPIAILFYILILAIIASG